MDGKQREDNIPLSTLQHFQKHYRDKAITREDIFHYVYAILHHPEYRARFAENLKRELPRIPLAGKAADFHAFAAAGRKLIDLHVHYEDQKAYPLRHVENPEAPLDWRVEAMKLSQGPRRNPVQRLPHAGRGSARSVRLPPRQPLRAGMGDRPVPRPPRRARRHRKRSQPGRR